MVSRQKQRRSSATDYNAVDESDGTQRIVMEVEALLEASEQLNWIRIKLTHDEFSCH